MRTKQEIGKELNERRVTCSNSELEPLEFEWMKATDIRTPYKWDTQMCVCGNDGWCGRDIHRPDFAVDENGQNIDFDCKGQAIPFVPEEELL